MAGNAGKSGKSNNAPSGGGTITASQLPKAALSKAEKTQIILANKKQISNEAMKTGDIERVRRINRMVTADRNRRKQENPNAPAFERARQAAETRLAKKEAKKQGMDATRNGKNKRPKFVNSGAFE